MNFLANVIYTLKITHTHTHTNTNEMKRSELGEACSWRYTAMPSPG